MIPQVPDLWAPEQLDAIDRRHPTPRRDRNRA
jgi:hypothetical protein